jgi:hypothetical protein
MIMRTPIGQADQQPSAPAPSSLASSQASPATQRQRQPAQPPAIKASDQATQPRPDNNDDEEEESLLERWKRLGSEFALLAHTHASHSRFTNTINIPITQDAATLDNQQQSSEMM